MVEKNNSVAAIQQKIFIEKVLKTREINPKQRVNYPKQLPCVNCKQLIRYTSSTGSYYRDEITANGFPNAQEHRRDNPNFCAWYPQSELFHRQVLNEFKKCIITGVGKKSKNLHACHIKPRGKCDNDVEKLDKNNGLLLTPKFHKLFDNGLFSFSDEGRIKFSNQLSEADRK
ncbi:11087_t:CDS:2 [Entrophospora sp. SA101]|nr:11087_t:CDS:2 [Entrophospora sp. SA101]